jgi:hypothetical protein
MAQYGLNAGPRHVCTLSVAKSIINKGNYTDEDMFRKDNAVLGVLSFLYNKFTALCPSPVVELHEQELDEDNLPGIRTDSIPEGETSQLCMHYSQAWQALAILLPLAVLSIFILLQGAALLRVI